MVGVFIVYHRMNVKNDELGKHVADIVSFIDLDFNDIEQITEYEEIDKSEFIEGLYEYIQLKGREDAENADRIYDLKPEDNPSNLMKFILHERYGEIPSEHRNKIYDKWRTGFENYIEEKN